MFHIGGTKFINGQLISAFTVVTGQYYAMNSEHGWTLLSSNNAIWTLVKSSNSTPVDKVGICAFE